MSAQMLAASQAMSGYCFKIVLKPLLDYAVTKMYCVPIYGLTMFYNLYFYSGVLSRRTIFKRLIFCT